MCDNCCTPFIEGEGCASALQKRASNVASGDYSVATGHGTIASNEGEMSTGTYNKPNDGQVFSVGVGTSDSNRMNAIQVNKDGSTSFLYNGRIVKLTDLIRNVSPSGQITLDVQGGYIVVSYDGGQTYHNLIAISELKGDPGITSVTAQIDSTTQELGVRATLSNGVLTLIFSGLQGGGGGTSDVAALNDLTDVTITSASNGQALVYRNGVWQNETIEGGGGGGDTPTPGEPGRSITGTQQWFKLSDSLSVTAPALSIADPSSVAGGSWTTSQLTTTEQLPYLWTFIQYNYDKVLDTGYMYSRSSAWRVSNYNADPSQEYEDLQRSIAGIYAELRADIDQYGVDLQNLSNALASLRTSVEGTITTELGRLRDRLASIDASELKIIEDDGLWYLMTSWTDQTGAKKAFADILADAQNAKIALDAGSTFFGANGHVGITLNGIESALSATATKSYVDSAIASAQFSVDPAALQSVISKGQQCWEKNGVLYPYTLHINDGSGFQNLVDYETYMGKSPTQGGPSSDAHGPAGPFTLVAVIGQISQIKQTADSISSTVGELKYMWRKNNNIYDYKDTDLWNAYVNRTSMYYNYDYDQYLEDVLGYEKVQVSEVLSGVTQKADEIEAIVGRVDKIWSKPKASGGYEYQKYVVPSNKTASQYESEMRNAGWTLTTYADEFGVISLSDEKIALAVKKAKYVWIDDSLAADNANYCKDYDAWLSTYESSSYSGTYEQYVAQYHPSYTLTRVADSMSQIKQESNRITSAVASIGTLGSRVSSVEQTASNISASVANMKKVWKNSTTGDIKDYEAYRNAYNSSGSSTSYESWVPANYSGYALSEVATELGGVSIKSDKIWAGVGDGNNVAASISILKGLGVNNGKIVLDANLVEVSNTLSANTVNAGFANIANINATTKNNLGRIVADNIDVTNLTVKNLNTAGDDSSIMKRIVASGNTLYMTDENGEQRFVLTGDEISGATPTSSYSQTSFDFQQGYSRPSSSDYSTTDSTSRTLFYNINVASGDTVTIPTINITGALLDYNSGTSEGDAWTEISLTTKLYNGNTFVRNLASGSFDFEGDDSGTVTLTGTTITGLSASSQYNILLVITLSIGIPHENTGGNINVRISNYGEYGNVTVFGDRRIVQIGANGMAIHLGGSFDAIFALDANDDPLICLQGRNSNNQIVGMRISSSGFEISTNGTWRTPS